MTRDRPELPVGGRTAFAGGCESPLLEVYQRLLASYGPQGWWPGDGPLDVVIGAILTQSTAWTNVVLALQALKRAGCWSLEAIYQCPEHLLAEIIRPSGYFNAKARKLKAFAAHVVENYGGDLETFLAGIWSRCGPSCCPCTGLARKLRTTFWCTPRESRPLSSTLIRAGLLIA